MLRGLRSTGSTGANSLVDGVVMQVIVVQMVELDNAPLTVLCEFA
jgi:hypothetical protein